MTLKSTVQNIIKKLTPMPIIEQTPKEVRQQREEAYRKRIEARKRRTY